MNVSATILKDTLCETWHVSQPAGNCGHFGAAEYHGVLSVSMKNQYKLFTAACIRNPKFKQQVHIESL
jgi:hypothetical protein